MLRASGKVRMRAPAAPVTAHTMGHDSCSMRMKEVATSCAALMYWGGGEVGAGRCEAPRGLRGASVHIRSRVDTRAACFCWHAAICHGSRRSRQGRTMNSCMGPPNFMKSRFRYPPAPSTIRLVCSAAQPGIRVGVVLRVRRVAGDACRARWTWGAGLPAAWRRPRPRRSHSALQPCSAQPSAAHLIAKGRGEDGGGSQHHCIGQHVDVNVVLCGRGGGGGGEGRGGGGQCGEGAPDERSTRTFARAAVAVRGALPPRTLTATVAAIGNTMAAAALLAIMRERMVVAT